MRYGFFSDVHGNLPALKATLKDMKHQGIDELIFLGDAVGYGADPLQCIKIVRKVSRIHIMGNHDHAAIGESDTTLFNPSAQWAIEWTRKVLRMKEINFLASQKMSIEFGEFYLVHSSPLGPENWGYILDSNVARENFPYFGRKICLIGHSHIPVFFIQKEGDNSTEMLKPTPLQIKDDSRYIINIGSVGQPRDRNPDACYLIYDTETMIAEHRRVPYNVKKTQKKMKKLGFPENLITRLEEGR